MLTVNDTNFEFAPFSGRVGFPAHSLTLIIKGTFDLVPNGVVKPADEQLFPTGDELYDDDDEGTGSSRYESDFAFYKRCADLLLAGKCYTPDGEPMQMCPVTFRVGNHTKMLTVVGDRFWEGVLGGLPGDANRQKLDGMSVAQRFTEMDLRYENSFGGSGYKKNPVGKGHRKKKSESGEKVYALPNIEDPNDLIKSSISRPDPAGFGPLGKMWGHRYSMVGTYKGNYLSEYWPWFPKDFDWGHYNAAPPDMQAEGYLRGDEEMYFENLHPEHAKYKTHLPGLRVRCFLNKRPPSPVDDGSGNAGRTPETPVTDAPASKTSGSEGSRVPPEVSGGQWLEVAVNLDTLWVDMEAEQVVLVWRGVTTVVDEDYEEVTHGFIVSEPLEDQPKSVEHYRELFHRRLAEMEAEDEVELEQPEPDEEDDADDTDAQIAQIEAEVRAAKIEAGIDPDAEPPPMTEENKAEQDRMLQELGVDPAELEDKEEEPPITREMIQERAVRKESFAQEELTGLDLSGLNLSGLDFTGSDLTGANLKQANLTETNLTLANLSNTDLTQARLHRATLKETDLTQANLTEADLTGATLEEAVFEQAKLIRAVLNEVAAKDADFTQADLTNAQLRNSTLDGADLSGATFDRADFTQSILRDASVEGVSAKGVNMTRADVTELRASDGSDFSGGVFREAKGFESIWEKANLENADFSFAKMEGADFTACRLVEANLYAADMPGARFAKANLQAARLIEMNLFRGSFEKADLRLADLTGSNCYEVEFLGANITDSKLDRTNLRMSKLRYWKKHG